MVEADELRDLEAVDKVKETGGIGMIIGEILCLFSYITCPLFLLPLELRIHPKIDYAVTSIGVDMKRITTDLNSGYWKVKFREAPLNKIKYWGRTRNSPVQICEWELSMHHWS